MIGINDVWRQFDSPNDSAPVTPQIFENTYRALPSKHVAHNKNPARNALLYGTGSLAEPMRARMDAYGAIVKKIAAEFDALLVDTQAALNAYLNQQPPGTLAEDRVHPNQTGHFILAKAILDSIGFHWDA